MRWTIFLLWTLAALAYADPVDFTIDGVVHHAQSHYPKDPKGKAVVLDGTLDVLHADYDDHGEFHYFVRDAKGKRTEINVDHLPYNATPGKKIHVEGRRTKSHTPFDPTTPESVDPSAIVLGQGTGGTTTTTTSTPSTGTTGAKQAAWIVVCWASTTCSTTSALPIAAIVNAFWPEASYNQLTMPATVIGVGLTQARPATCDYSSWTSTAMSKAGVTQGNYRSVVFIASLPCGWRGLAYVNWNMAWTNGLTPAQVFQHEMGHNLGLLHAGSVGKPGGGVTEYGDAFSSMGNIAAMHYNAPQKNILGWLSGKTGAYASGTQTYTLDPLETAGGALYAVKIPTPNSSRTYWVEYRLPLGVDNIAKMGSGGVLVHLSAPFQSSAGSDDTQVIQVSSSWFLLGHYDDPDYPLSIALVSASPTSAVVTVGPVPFLAPTGLRVSP